MLTATRLVTFLALLVTTAPLAAQREQSRPVTGQYVLQRMHDAYAGKWYKTLTFTQKTTRYVAGGSPVTQTWYESMRYTPQHGTQLRIDIGDLKFGRGIYYTADSSISITAGKPGVPRAEGNEFIPLIQGVYVQPVAQTAGELTRLGFDLTKAYQSVHEGLAVWVVGSANPADTMSSRFMVDTARKVLTRAVLVRNRQTIEVGVAGYVRAGGGWLATQIDMRSRGVPLQTEEYSDWKVDVPLADALFDVNQWSSAPHWLKKP